MGYTPSFSRYLRQLQQRHSRSVNEFARQLDVDPTHLSRAMGSNGRPFDVLGCLRLAELTSENPGTVLRAAGRGDIATRIERLYGRAVKQGPPQSARLREATKLWEVVEADGRQSQMLDVIVAMLRYAEEATKGDNGGNSKQRSTNRTRRTA
jgi:hypothetical protein